MAKLLTGICLFIILNSSDLFAKNRCLTALTKISAPVVHIIKRLFLKNKKYQQSLPSFSVTTVNKPKSREYRVHNKDDDKPRKSNDSNRFKASTNIKDIRYFVEMVYQEIEIDTGLLKAIDHKQSTADEAAPENLATLNLPNAKLTDILVPDGYEPIESDAVLRDQTGNYLLKDDNTIQEISIRKAKLKDLDLEEREVYLKINGIQLTNWPEWLQDSIKQLKTLYESKKISDEEVADLLAQVLRINFLYSVDGDELKGLIALANRGHLQCDGAAAIAVSILRSEFKIPARVVSGYRASIDKGSPDYSIVLESEEGHAWFQIHSQKDRIWKSFDPTPSQDDKERKYPKPESGRFFKPADQRPRAPNNPVKEFANKINWQIFWQETLESWHDIKTIQKNIISIIFSADCPAEIKSVAQQILSLIQLYNLSWNDSSEIALELSKNYQPGISSTALRGIYTYLLTIFSAISRTRILDKNENDLLLYLRHLTSNISDTSTDDIKARSFISSLPGSLSRSFFSGTYGSDNSLHSAQLLTDISENRLDSWIQLIQIKSYLNLWLDRIQRKTMGQEFTGELIPMSASETHLQRLTDMGSEFSTILKDGPPELDGLRAVMGDLFTVKHRAEIDVPKNEMAGTHTLTIIVRDNSTSMGDDNKWRSRDALTAAYIDISMSKKNNEIIVLDYEDEPLPARHLHSKNDSLQLIQKLMSKTASGTSGGNNTTKALEKAFEFAKNISFGKTKINIILITDGEESIDPQMILNERANIPSNIELTLNAITLVTGNASIKVLTEKLKPNGEKTRSNKFKSQHQHLDGAELDQLLNTTQMKHNLRRDNDNQLQFDLSNLTPSTVLEGQLKIQLAGSRKPAEISGN